MTNSLNYSLGIIAGSGDLPVILSNSVENAFVVGIDGFCNLENYSVECQLHGLAKMGAIVKTFKDKNITDIVIAGGIKRPALSTLMPDAMGAKLIAILALKGGGDDKALRIVVSFLEEQGFVVKSVEDILGSQTIERKVLTQKEPSGRHMGDIARGMEILDATSELDIGQGVIIQEGLVLAIEAIEGTDEMIKRTINIVRDGSSPVLVKMIKKNQSRTVDLPTIGVNTITNLHAMGSGGIAISSYGIIILNEKSVVEMANKLGLFIVAV